MKKDIESIGNALAIKQIQQNMQLYFFKELMPVHRQGIASTLALVNIKIFISKDIFLL